MSDDRNLTLARNVSQLAKLLGDLVDDVLALATRVGRIEQTINELESKK